MIIGVILFILGILLIFLGFFYRKKKEFRDPLTIMIYTFCVLLGIVLLFNSLFLITYRKSVNETGGCSCEGCSCEGCSCVGCSCVNCDNSDITERKE